LLSVYNNTKKAKLMIETDGLINLLLNLPMYLIIGWLFYSIIVLFIPYLRFRISNFYIIEVIPNVFVTLGLLGTFMGIAYGLSKFNTDPDLIKTSIKILLDGLKSALNTSILGIFLSLIFSKIVKYKFASETIKNKDSDELKELKLLNKNIIDLKEEFSKTQHDALVEALRDVLTGFDSILMNFIDELVEKNFDKLTDAINQLIRWQLLYKEDIIELKQSYSSLVNKHEQFINNTEKWVSLMEEVAGQSSKLQFIVDNFNEAFNDNGNLSLMVTKMQESAKNLENVTNDFSKLTKRMEDTTTTLELTEEKIQEWTQPISSVSETSGEIVSHLSTIQDFRVKDLNNLSDEFNNRLATTFGTFDSLMKKYIESIENRINI
jgi:methyl-accepting chemotaxis protein